jgi:hypothetical protein
MSLAERDVVAVQRVEVTYRFRDRVVVVAQRPPASASS